MRSCTIPAPSGQSQNNPPVDVSVLIPVYGQWAMTQVCLQSLWEHWPQDLSGQCIVHDDQSPDQTPDQLAAWHPAHNRLRLQILQGPGQTSYAQANNRMAQGATGALLVMLNNDTVLAPGWLPPMIQTLAAHPDAGIVGNQQRYPTTGHIHHAGGCFAPDGLPVHLYDGWPAQTPGVERNRPVQFVTAAAWVMRRETFHRLGGFDASYRYGYEDIDLCLRARRAGLGVWYCGQSVIGHHGGSTPGRYAQDHKNLAVFRKRWGRPRDGHYALDAASLAAEDGNHFPDWPLRLRLARRAKQSPVVANLLAASTRVGFLQRLRKRMHTSLTRSSLTRSAP